jgi:membrane protein DedA with SNARE-associated domain/rhodanese-related sulfurtransferase
LRAAAPPAGSIREIIVTAFIRNLPEHGALLVFLAVLLEQGGIPLPSFTVLVAAGALVAGGQVSAAAVLAAAVGAALLANLAWYLAGVRYGQKVLRMLCKVSLSPDTCVRMTQSIFVRWGLASLLFSKFIPGISLVAPPIAGAIRMPALRFLLASSFGTLLWAAVYLALGYVFRDQIDQVFAYGSEHLQVVLHFAAYLLLIYIAYRAVRRWIIVRGAGVPRIEVAELRRLLGLQPQPLVLDLRSDLLREGNAGVPGSLPVELAVLEDRGRAAAYDFPHDRDIVTYCACPNDISAVRAARALRRRGYARTVVLRGGAEAWSAGLELPIEPLPVR